MFIDLIIHGYLYILSEKEQRSLRIKKKQLTSNNKGITIESKFILLVWFLTISIKYFDEQIRLLERNISKGDMTGWPAFNFIGAITSVTLPVCQHWITQGWICCQLQSAGKQQLEALVDCQSQLDSVRGSFWVWQTNQNVCGVLAVGWLGVQALICFLSILS